jgi:DNA-binding GntR family transcriptional regulator
MSSIKNVDNDKFDKLYDSYRYFFADNCGNLFFTTQMNLVYDHLHRIRKVLYGNSPRRLEALEEHIYIIDSILENKPVSIIKELCEKHIEEAQMDFFKNLDNLHI